MGLAAFRLLSSNAEKLASFRAADPEGGARVYAEGGQRLFIDFTSVVRSAVGRAVIPRVLDWMEARSAAVLRSLFDEPRLTVTNPSPFGFFRRILRIFVDFAVPFWILRALANPDLAHARVRSIGEALARRLEPPASATANERVELAVQGLGREVLRLGPQLLPLAASGLGMLAFASHLLGEDATQAELQTVLRGLPHNVTTEMDLELWRIAGELRRDPEAMRAFREASVAELARRYAETTLPAIAQKRLEEFLSVYGHRAVAEIDLGMPRWSDEPAHILGVLANYLRLEDPALAPDVVFARGAREAEAMIDTLVARARERSPLHADLVRFALGRARRLAGLREAPKFFIVLALATVRRSLAIVGAELAQRGAIAAADDVFFLDLEDVRKALDGRDSKRLVSERRLAYEAELRRRHVPRVLLSDGTEPEATTLAAASHEGDLSGTPASAGEVTAKARVILDPVGAHIEPGEILVAPSTDPGWTPLFLTAGGLVMEMGGANSHGAVVAREYGIPAVVGVSGATQRIHTGEIVRVDGASGIIALAR
jgi:rifampicin phosphotransferase